VPEHSDALRTAAAPPALRAARALEGFAREPGRSAHVVVQTPAHEWAGGAAADELRPAASLLKLPVAMAAEGVLDTGTVAVAELLGQDGGPSVLRLLDPRRELSGAEVLRLAVGASDGPCARWLWQRVDPERVARVIQGAGCRATSLSHEEDGRFLRGVTTAADAVALLRAADQPERFPITSAALRASIRNSRIPLGARSGDVEVAHKTGTLPGVANDVAVLRCRGGQVWAAFLSEGQHDTIVTGYEMGICTREVVAAWGLSVRHTVSVLVGE